MIGVVRAPVAFVTVRFFAQGLLVKSCINSEIFTGIRHEINYYKRCAHDPSY